MPDYSYIDEEMLVTAQAGHAISANLAIEALAKGAGVISVSLTAGSVTLTKSQSQAGVILLTGAPGASRVVTLDAGVARAVLFRNDTSGAQVIEVEQTGGTNFPAPAGGCVLLLSTTQALTFHSDTSPSAHTKTASAGTSGQLSRVDHRHPRDWVTMSFNQNNATLTNIPSAVTSIQNQLRRLKYDLTNFTEARVSCDVAIAANAGAVMRGQFSTNGSSWSFLDGSAGPSTVLDVVDLNLSSWVSLAAGAKAEVFLRLITQDGDGAADPVIGMAALQFR